MKTAKGILVGFVMILCIASAVLIGLGFAVAITNEEKITLDNASHIGAIIAALTSAIGVILLYLTYRSQRRELRVTQEALRLQKVDTAFFNMLALLQEFVKAMSEIFVKSQGGEEKLEGRVYLKRALEQLQNEYLAQTITNMRPNMKTGAFNPFQPSLFFITGSQEDKNTEIVNERISTSYRDLLVEVSEKYEEFYEEHQRNLGHYFRYIYNIIKYILDPINRLNEEDIKRYLGILQSQLSNDEMGLIFYNVLSKHGQTTNGEHRFLNWLDNYKMLENMDSQSLCHEWHHWFFPKTIFKFLDIEERVRKRQYTKNLAKFDIPN